MLLLLSPAKSLDYESPLPDLPHSEPLFVPESVKLIRELRKYKPAQIAELMDLSEDLSRLNVARYKAWRRAVPQDGARQAVLAFDGDVYGGLDAEVAVGRRPGLGAAASGHAQRPVRRAASAGPHAALPAGDEDPAAERTRCQPVPVLGRPHFAAT